VKRGPDLKPAIAVGLGVVLLTGGAAFWMSSVASGSRQRADKLAMEVPKEADLKADLETTKTKLADIQARLEHLEQGVPSLAYVPTLLTELENLGLSNQVKVTGVRPVVNNNAQKPEDKTSGGGAPKKKAYEEISIDITGRGSYGNVMRMVESLLKFPKVVSVQTVSLTPVREAAQNGQAASLGTSLEAVVRIKAYVFADPQESGQEPSGSDKPGPGEA
jgi:Tfp pilus assembly protein PilO